MKIFKYLIAVMVITACSKDRVELLEENISYESMDSFLEANRPSAQVFIVDTGGSGPIIANGGTQLWLDSSIFVDSSGVSPTYPFEVSLLELYSISDMILWDATTGRDGNLPLFSEGIMKLNASKDGQDLSVKFGKEYLVDFVRHHGQVANLFEGYGGNGSQATYWLPSSDALVDNQTFITFGANSIGWLQAYGSPSLNAVNSHLSLDIPGTDIQNVKQFFVIGDYNALLPVQGGLTLKGGLNVKVVCFAKQGNNEYKWFEETVALTSNRNVEVIFETVTEQGLLSKITSL
jgi:hypothetical protein